MQQLHEHYLSARIPFFYRVTKGIRRRQSHHVLAAGSSEQAGPSIINDGLAAV